MLWECFATGGTGALHKVDGVMRRRKLCGYIEATSHLLTPEVTEATNLSRAKVS